MQLSAEDEAKIDAAFAGKDLSSAIAFKQLWAQLMTTQARHAILTSQYNELQKKHEELRKAAMRAAEAREWPETSQTRQDLKKLVR